MSLSLKTFSESKPAQALLIGIVSSALTLLVWFFTPLLDGWENITWNWRVKALARPSPATESIKVILIDQNSLDWASRELGINWPWPRELQAVAVDFARRGGAKAIAYDMLYSEPSSYMVSDDVIFGESIAAAENFVGAFFLGEQAGQTSSWPEHVPHPITDQSALADWMAVHTQAKLEEPRASFPVPEVARAAAMLGHVKGDPDADGVFRRATPFRIFDGQAVPMLALGAWLAGEGVGAVDIRSSADGLALGDRDMPLDRKGRAILRFRGPSGTHETLSAAAVIQSEIRLREGGSPVIDPGELRDAYVLFGVSAPGLKDQRPTPISGDYSGVELHATFLDNLLAGDFIRDASRLWSAIFIWAMASCAAGGILFCRGVGISLAVAFVLLVLPVGVGFVAYLAGWWWPVVAPAGATAMAMGAASVLNYATEGRQKRFIKGAFRQYLSGEVIEQMLAHPERLKLGGEKRELTIFFSDLQGFSAISEKLGPEALTALLNDYLTDMSDIIMEEGGTVDKYEGDAIVAFWNAPVTQADHAARACRAALRCQRKLAERRREFEERAGVELYMRIGLHTGEVVVGNMGSHQRFNYTVLGDAANLASRLEGANKQFGTYLMISDAVWRKAQPDGFIAREIGMIQVVGRKTPVQVFELLGLPGERIAAAEDWARAMLHFRGRRWEDAIKLFSTFKNDPLARMLEAKSRALTGGHDSEWQDVWVLSGK
ncbi:MAG: CHASE2 domain-containing protein [Kiritimatiellia bacterium]